MSRSTKHASSTASSAEHFFFFSTFFSPETSPPALYRTTKTYDPKQTNSSCRYRIEVLHRALATASHSMYHMNSLVCCCHPLPPNRPQNPHPTFRSSKRREWPTRIKRPACVAFLCTTTITKPTAVLGAIRRVRPSINQSNRAGQNNKYRYSPREKGIFCPQQSYYWPTFSNSGEI